MKFDFKCLHSIAVYSTVLIVISTTTSSAQVTLEHVYPEGSLKTYMVNLEQAGPKYVLLYRDYPDYRWISFYHLDHSFWFNIDCNPLPASANLQSGFFTPLYISQHLFDSDDGIEFMFVLTSPWFTGIYNDDGSPIITVDSAAPLVAANVPQAWRPIYNTPNGTKMILSMMDGSSRVYGLAGTLESNIDEMPIHDFNDYLNAFPNPAFYETEIDFTLPQGINRAQLKLFDLSGHEVHSYNVDNTFGNLLINQSDISPGTYVYALMHDGKVLDTQEIVFSK